MRKICKSKGYKDESISLLCKIEKNFTGVLWRQIRLFRKCFEFVFKLGVSKMRIWLRWITYNPFKLYYFTLDNSNNLSCGSEFSNEKHYKYRYVSLIIISIISKCIIVKINGVFWYNCLLIALQFLCRLKSRTI